MIIGIRSLEAQCSTENCVERAVFEVERSNDELTGNFVQSGTRTVYHCTTHTPDDVYELWNGAL